MLRATFPAGTVSGAPKVRAMQIISELEGYRRGTYAGVVGYHVPGLGLDTCIAIRTVLLRDGRAYLQAGGGIVADSDPAAEHRECLNKLAALEAALDARGATDVILLVDNYDSFTYNLAHLFGELGADVLVRRTTRSRRTRPNARTLPPRHLARARTARGRRRDAGDPPAARRRVPTLGVCLGHQAIVADLRRRGRAGTRARARQGDIRQHDGRGIFAGLPDGFQAGRYHSLAATSVPDVFEVSATAADGEVMAVRHRELPLDGVQFHPESVLTPHGIDLIRNFLG